LFWSIMTKSNCCCFGSISLTIIFTSIIHFYIYERSLQNCLASSGIRNEL
jgi:hypothetical protein